MTLSQLVSGGAAFLVLTCSVHEPCHALSCLATCTVNVCAASLGLAWLQLPVLHA